MKLSKVILEKRVKMGDKAVRIQYNFIPVKV